MFESNSTAEYWRKCLGLDRPPEPGVIRRCNSPLRLFYPLIFTAVNFFIDRLCRCRFEGLENINLAGPFILASNHLSNLDYPFLVRKLPPAVLSNLYVVAKKWLYRHPQTRFFVEACANCVFVDDREDFMAALRTASDLLRLGKSIYIAPEGQRSYDGGVGDFKAGVGVLMVENNVPVIPVKIEGTYDVLPRGRFFPCLFQSVTVKFGRAWYPAEFVKSIHEENAYYIYKAAAEELRKKIISL